jgi:2-iminobutanoate/2-iminopropanoate deaminase
MKQVITTPDAPKPVGPYSQATLAGNTLYISGQLAINPKDNKIVQPDITVQTRQVMQNIQAILQAANFSLKDVVQTTVYLASMTLFNDFNCEYAKHFPEAPPARSTVACQLKEGALVEISAVAYKVGTARSFDKL